METVLLLCQQHGADGVRLQLPHIVFQLTALEIELAPVQISAAVIVHEDGRIPAGGEFRPLNGHRVQKRPFRPVRESHALLSRRREIIIISAVLLDAVAGRQRRHILEIHGLPGVKARDVLLPVRQILRGPDMLHRPVPGAAHQLVGGVQIQGIRIVLPYMGLSVRRRIVQR